MAKAEPETIQIEFLLNGTNLTQQNRFDDKTSRKQNLTTTFPKIIIHEDSREHDG